MWGRGSSLIGKITTIFFSFSMNFPEFHETVIYLPALKSIVNVEHRDVIVSLKNPGKIYVPGHVC